MQRPSIALVLPSVLTLVVSGFHASVLAGTTCTIDGSAGGEVIIGTSGRDVICARGGADWIDPRGGNDLVLAGPGNDFVRGSGGADVVKGGVGQDYLVGGAGPDKLRGGDGSDRCLNVKDSVSGNDTANGGAGFDTGTRNPGDTFVSIEQEAGAPLPDCPPEPPKPFEP
jgi:Ca2+-binding RTX toxin-like protein